MALPKLSKKDRIWYILQGYVIRVGPGGNWREWLLNGKLHREGGPAIEWADGAKEWWINGELHREDGPAYEIIHGTKEWWLNGKEMSEEEHKLAVAKLRNQNVTS